MSRFDEENIESTEERKAKIEAQRKKFDRGKKKKHVDFPNIAKYCLISHMGT